MGLACRNRIFFCFIACATLFVFIDQAMKYTVVRNTKETYNSPCETKVIEPIKKYVNSKMNANETIILELITVSRHENSQDNNTKDFDNKQKIAEMYSDENKLEPNVSRTGL